MRSCLRAQAVFLLRGHFSLSEATAMENCKLQLGDMCHQPKKGHFVCKSCWEQATADQQELLKAWDSSYCKARGCFEWKKAGSDFCIKHNVCRTITSLSNEAAIAKAVTTEAVDKRRAGDSSRSPREVSEKRAGRLAASIRNLSTPELKVMLDNCVHELYERAAASSGCAQPVSEKDRCLR